MDIKAIHTYLEKPELLTTQQLPLLEYVIKKYPFFQAARSLRLKILKDNGSYLYNQSLKETAAHTTDREVLFDFITSDLFKKTIASPREVKEEAVVEPDPTPQFEKTTISPLTEAAETITEIIETSSNEDELPILDLTSDEATQIVDPDLFQPIEEQEVEALKEELTTKPLDFNKNEIHSFNEWLQLSSLKIVHRSTNSEAPITNTKPKLTIQPNLDTTKVSPQKKIVKIEKKEVSNHLIDKFIETNPKISPLKKVENQVNLAKLNNKVPTDLMTETLAKVYLAQHNYKKAIQAYKILSLKNPEKSGFFADQIRKIEKLQANK